jgi:hypothetical protein
MRMVEAARRTLELAVSKGYDSVTSDMPELDHAHCSVMVETMAGSEREWSEGKMGRWLGWLQAACVFGTDGAISLEDCKRINMECAEDLVMRR